MYHTSRHKAPILFHWEFVSKNIVVVTESMENKFANELKLKWRPRFCTLRRRSKFTNSRTIACMCYLLIKEKSKNKNPFSDPLSPLYCFSTFNFDSKATGRSIVGGIPLLQILSVIPSISFHSTEKRS